MNFFTPDLYVRLNSADDVVVDKAAKEWSNANEAYIKHLDQLFVKLPPNVKAVAFFDQFHDAKILSQRYVASSRVYWRSEHEDPMPMVEHFEIVAKNADSLLFLTYVLQPRNKERRPVLQHIRHEREGSVAFPFLVGETYWLYDEMTINPEWAEWYRAVLDFENKVQPQLEHRILLSDGAELVIDFMDVFFTVLPLKVVCENFDEVYG